MQPIVVKIDLAGCINCSLCRRACPTEAINYFSTGHRTHVVDPDWCIGCDICIRVCPVDCIHEDTEYVVEPLDATVASDSVKLHARLTGNFPNSPVELDFTFVLANDKIAKLVID